MDDLDLLDPVDVLAKLPEEFRTNTESKKWTDRRDALQGLLDLLEKHPKLDLKANYGEIVDILKATLEKDANINVAALSAKCLKGIANGLRAKFAPYAPSIMPVVFEKFKEKKALLRDPLIECADTINLTFNIEQIQDDIVAAMNKPNPSIKAQTDMFLHRAFKRFNSATMPKKLLKALSPVLVKHTGDPDAEVREASYAALGSAMRATGEKPIMILLADIAEDKMKMDKIKDFYQKILDEVGADGLQVAQSKPVSHQGSVATPAAQENIPVARAVPAEADPFDLLDPVDVLAKLPEEFRTNTESKKWTDRRDALQGLLDLLEKHPKLDLKANYGEIVDILKATLEKDANINVAALSAKCLKGIANGLRAKFAPYAPSIMPVVFEKFKEKKALLRDPLIECADTINLTFNIEQIQDDIVAAMNKPNPSIKAQTDMFLHRAFKRFNSATMPKKLLKALSPVLVKHTGDSDAEVREASYAALGSAMRAIGEKPIMILLADIAEDKMKMDKIKDICNKLLEELGPEIGSAVVQATAPAEPAAATLPPKAPPKGTTQKKPPISRSGSVQSVNEAEVVETQKPATKKPERKAAPPAKTEEDVVQESPKSSELLAVNDGKAQRLKEERQMKLLKWNFPIPTEEHIAQLNQQLSSAAKVSLTQLLFSKDFKQHMKAIELLRSTADVSPEGIVKNSDLLLKWCTLRFFETNPAVLIQVLELCKLIVELIRETDEPVSIEEITSFVPYLLLKAGDPKENMRKVIHEIVDLLTGVCGPLKLAPFVIDALKTKNSRQRIECLIILEEYVVRGTVAALKATGIHKAIGACVSDRDNGVRSAAINGLVACYREEGDQMWRNVGKLADKDRSYVEERIKRTGAAPGSSKPPVMGTPSRGGAKVVVPPNAGGTVVRRNRSRSRLPEVEDPDDDQEGEPEEPADATRVIRASNSRYQIDEDFVELVGIHALPSSHLMQEAESYMPRIPSAPMRPTPTMLKRTSSSSSISSLDTFDQLEKVIHNVSSGITDVAHEALEQVTYMMNSEEQKLMIEDRISMTMKAVATQLNLVRKIHGVHSNKGNSLLKLILNFLVGVIKLQLTPAKSHQEMYINMDEDSMFEWLYAIIPILPALDGDNDEQIKKSFNVTIIRVSQRVEVTVFFVGCAKSLQNILKEDPSSPCVELFVKCLYKWQDVVKKQPQPLRLNVFLAAANEFYHNLSQDDLYAEHIKTMELCLQHAILIMGDAVQDGIRRLANPNHKLVSYCNVFLQQMYATDPNWTPKLPGAVAKELPVPKSAKQDSVMRREIHILVDNVVRDLNSMYVDMAQAAMTQSAKLEKILKSGMENGAGANHVLTTRDINTESFTSDLPLPSNLTRPPVEERSVRKVRRSIDPSVYNAIQNKLAGISDA